MELLLICGIVVGAIVIAAHRILRTMREPSPPCCGCDTCAQPEAVKNACCSGNAQGTESGIGSNNEQQNTDESNK